MQELEREMQELEREMQELEKRMHANPSGRPHSISRTGSFFKLIDMFASEIGELKNIFVQTTTDVNHELAEVVFQGLEEQVSHVKSAPHRDSGYDSMCSRMSMTDRLRQTHAVWLLLGLGDEETKRILLSQPPGAFLVRRSGKTQKKVISLRLDEVSEAAVHDFPVREHQYTFSLEGSGISFADLFCLVAFYCVSRDVLPTTLLLPEAISSAKTKAELEKVAQLGAVFWDSALCTRKNAAEQKERSSPSSNTLDDPQTCVLPDLKGIQSSSALHFLNPLFFQDPPTQKDSAVPHPSPVPLPSLQHPSAPQEQRRMPEMVYWIHPNLKSETNLPSNQVAATPPPCPDRPLSQTIEKTLYRCLARTLGSPPEEDGSSTPCGPEEATSREERTETEQWLSDMSISTSSSESLEISSYGRSVQRMTDSSLEEEEEAEDDDDDEAVVLEVEGYSLSLESSQEVPVRSTRKDRKYLTVLQRPLRKMSGALGSLVTPERRTIWQVQRLAHDKTTYFGCLVQDYVSFMQESQGFHTTSLDLLQTLRQFMTQTKAYLNQSSELDPLIHSLIPEDQIDQVLEKALQKCVLKPLKNMVDTTLQSFQERSGEMQRLKENFALAKTKLPQELGVDSAVVPDAVLIEKIRHKFHAMRKTYSPEKKVMLLLQVSKLIYSILESNSGRSCGADDFLPMLTYTLAQCALPQLDVEIQYMMELLDPSLLHGEGGYYLTSAYGAMSLIKNLQEEQAAQVLISETHSTLRQWHCRRTTYRSMPTVEDFQSYLRVALHNVDNGCTAKTLRVAPYTTTEEVCRLCAERFQVPDPENYALFLLTGESSQQLAPDTYPQKIKAEIHKRPQTLEFHFVYSLVSSPEDQLNRNAPS